MAVVFMIVKISMYIALLFLYITLGAVQSNLLEGPEIDNLESLNLNYRPPYTLILKKQLVSGIFTKSYYHVYKLIGPFVDIPEYRLKVSKKFYQKNIGYQGLSLLCKGKELVLIPTFAGGCFLNEDLLGTFIKDKWVFHQNYEYLKNSLEWYIVPTLEIYQQMVSNVKEKIPYRWLWKF